MKSSHGTKRDCEGGSEERRISFWNMGVELTSMWRYEFDVLLIDSKEMSTTEVIGTSMRKL